MKNLIICEKPSLAKNVCNGLKLNGESFKKVENYYESDNYIVTAVFGHLFGLYDLNDYTGIAKKWDISDIPFKPNEFKYKLKEDYKTKKVDKGIKKQFELIKSLINSDKVSSVTNCGDADREGEIIVRIVLSEAGNTKPVYRLWLPEQTEETIAKEIKKMIPANNYDNLAEEGFTRQYIDWLFGINYTRYATLKSGTLLRVGRVITPIVKIIYDRNKEIEEFVAIPYYQLYSKEKTNDTDIELLTSEKYEDQNDSELVQLLESLNSHDTVVTDIKKKDKVIESPKLFSQSDLQNYLSKKYKYKPSDTLKLTQQLYEKAYVTYPRTPTNYLSENEKDKVRETISKIVSSKNKSIIFKDSKRIFDNSKIESHSAIIPTGKIPDLNSLSEAEQNCYKAIYNRFCAVFCEEQHIKAETIMVLSNNGYDFTLKGSITIQEGYLRYDNLGHSNSSKSLPNVSVGDKIESNFKKIKKMTNPPKYWTVETLNNYLKNPFRKTTDSEEEIYKNLLKGLEIGTEATRSGIIDNAIRSNYINLKSSTYHITENGKYLVETIDKLGIDMTVESTAILGSQLKSLYNSEITQNELLHETIDTITEVIKKDTIVEKHEEEIESLGTCPICSKNIIENKVAYTCEDKDCRFVIWKNSNFVTKFGKKKLTKTNVKNLLSNGTVHIKGLTSQKGNKYDCNIDLEITDKWINLKPNFDK